MRSPKNDKEENKNITQENHTNSTNKPTSDIADTLAMILIDKIISSAVITNKVNQTYKTLNDHCFNYLTNFINPYLETNFIFYENGVEDPEYHKNQIYFSKEPLEKLNTWDIIPEPEANEIDRYENTKTKVMKYKKYSENPIEGVKESSLAFDVDEDTQIVKNNEQNNLFNESIDIQINKVKEKDNTYQKNIKEKQSINTNKENKDISNSNIKQKNQPLTAPNF